MANLVIAADIMEYALDDHPIDPRGRASYLEWFIHSEIYKLRPDVHSVIHSHSPGVVPFGVSDVPLKPISHMRGHGDTVVGQSIQTAVFHAIYVEQNARLQSEAMRLGGRVTFLSAEEAAKTGKQMDSLVDRPWELWKRRVLERMPK